MHACKALKITPEREKIAAFLEKNEYNGIES
jgi:hypothetical protein